MGADFLALGLDFDLDLDFDLGLPPDKEEVFPVKEEVFPVKEGLFPVEEEVFPVKERFSSNDCCNPFDLFEFALLKIDRGVSSEVFTDCLMLAC